MLKKVNLSSAIVIGMLLHSSVLAFAHDSLSLRISESSVNQSLKTLTDANALGVSKYKGGFELASYEFQINNANIDLVSGNKVKLTVDTHAKANINLAITPSFKVSGSANVSLSGKVALRQVNKAGYQLIFKPNPDFTFNIKNFPDTLEDLFSGMVNVIIAFSELFFGWDGIPLNSGMDLLPAIPENAVISTTPDFVVTDDEIFLTLEPKVDLPNLFLNYFTHDLIDGALEFKVTVRNFIPVDAGAQAKYNFNIRLFDGNPDANRDYIIDTPLPPGVVEIAEPYVIPVLDPDKWITATFRVFLPLGSVHRVFVFIDGTNEVYELSELDNVGSVVISLIDTDGDGLTDHEEVCFDGDCNTYDPYDPIENPTGKDTDLNEPDTDGDDLNDGEEIKVYDTNPVKPDTDDDGVNDKDDIFPLDPSRWTHDITPIIMPLLLSHVASTTVIGRDQVDFDITLIYDPTFKTCGCTPENDFVGKFSFEATLKNKSSTPLSGLMVEVTNLENIESGKRENRLILPDGNMGGVGAMFPIPRKDEYLDGVLRKGESVTVHFDLCLGSWDPFLFYVNVLGIVE